MNTLYSSKHAEVIYYPEKKAAVITTKTEYLPMEVFQEMFSEISAQLKGKTIERLIFDKRSLKVFHQPSMEWYYNEWKPAMLKDYGLRKHYKLLPDDKLFRKSVDIGREKILMQAKEGSALKQLEIRYFDQLEDAYVA